MFPEYSGGVSNDIDTKRHGFSVPLNDASQWVNYSVQSMVCRISFPLTMNITISATLVAWSAIRSRHLEI